MEITASGNTPATPGMSNDTESILNRASARVHAAVSSVAGAADDAARKAGPAVMLFGKGTGAARQKRG